MESKEENKRTNKIERDTQRADWRLSEGKGWGVWVEEVEGIKYRSVVTK